MTPPLAPLLPPDPFAIQRLRAVDWLFFDVGYTLSDETGGWQDQFERLAAVLRTTPGATPRSVDELWSIYLDACSTFAPGQWLAICERCAASPSDVESLRGLNKGWRHDLERPYPGVADALARLATRYRLGVIANQSHGTRDRLDGWGLLQHFTVIVGSAEAGVTKPDPAIFHLALREANCDPSRAAMIGDRLDNDVAPANRLGMPSVHIRQGGSAAQRPRTDIEQPTLSFDTVPALAMMLA